MRHARKPSPGTTLNDFGDLRRALRKAAREAAAQAAARAAAQAEGERAERARQRLAESDAQLFKSAVGPVHPLVVAARAALGAPRPAPLARQRQRDEAAVLLESLSDEFTVETLLDTDESLSWRRPEVGVDVVRKLRRGVWALQGQLDLHGLRSEEARAQVSAFLRQAQSKGWRCVRIVHGKGLGSPGRLPVLKDKTHRWLAQSERVLAFVQARADEGGAGAVVVLLSSVQAGKAPGPSA